MTLCSPLGSFIFEADNVGDLWRIRHVYNFEINSDLRIIESLIQTLRARYVSLLSLYQIDC